MITFESKWLLTDLGSGAAVHLLHRSTGESKERLGQGK